MIVSGTRTLQEPVKERLDPDMSYMRGNPRRDKLMDWMDEAVRGAAPPALGAEVAAAAQAEDVARAVVAGSRDHSRKSRFRRFLGGSALGIGILGVGITAAAAGPAVFEWVGWTPDVVAQRSFDLGEEGAELGLCEVFIRVVPDYGGVSNEEAVRRTEEARKFLAENDWEPLLASISETEIQAAFAAEEAQRSTPFPNGSMPPPPSLSLVVGQLMADRISDEFEEAGHQRTGVSMETVAGPCDGATEGSAQ